ncbi:hypothetical protein FJSC11DRAFT_4245 [Fischerella thermalis JSC-11]|uniref:Uncharacterized protein n=1 Tax=Fischerella thermalis JSC-11 TaxID=741277 RepID=G6FZE6_9CYAN|nr:hypothetical protein FJSC11DRAFT_4245 [Fischerella thermalis JSC-11]
MDVIVYFLMFYFSWGMSLSFSFVVGQIIIFEKKRTRMNTDEYIFLMLGLWML